MKKIVFIIYSTHKVYWGWFRYLNKHYDLYLITKKGVKKVHFIEKNKQIFLDDKNEKYKKIIKKVIPGCYFVDLKNLEETLKKINPDVVLSKVYYYQYSYVAYKYTKKNNKKYILVEEQRNNPKFLFTRIMFYILKKRLMGRYNKTIIVGPTKDAYKYLKKNGMNAIYIPVSFEGKIIPKKKFEDELKIISVGRLVPMKNFETLIEAVSILKNKRIKIICNVYGDGYLRKRLENIVKKKNLDKNILFHGNIENNLLMKKYQENNLFILPSKIEPIGQVVLEAMSKGLPIIVSNNCGSKDYIKNNYNGYIFKAKNPKDLANKILKLKDKEKRMLFGNRSIELIKKNHSIDVVGKQLDKLIK